MSEVILFSFFFSLLFPWEEFVCLSQKLLHIITKSHLVEIAAFANNIRHTVDVYKSTSTIIWTPIFEWYMDWCGSKKDVYLEEIGLSDQSMLPILGLT